MLAPLMVELKLLLHPKTATNRKTSGKPHQEREHITQHFTSINAVIPYHLQVIAVSARMADFSKTLKPQYDGSAILQAERTGSNISIDELSNHLLSRNDFLHRQDRIVRVLENDPLFSKAQQLNLSRPDRYHLGLARAKALRRLTVKHGWDMEDFKMAEYLTDEMSPYHLQFSMFATTVREQASEEQLREWWPRIVNYEVLGCYAQTELGHGSNVRGLECQARYDPRTREFVVHSPTLTASKWWNGSMG